MSTSSGYSTDSKTPRERAVVFRDLRRRNERRARLAEVQRERRVDRERTILLPPPGQARRAG